MKKVEPLNVDGMIEKCLEARGSKPGTLVKIDEGQVRALCNAVRDVFMSQSPLIELEAPIKVCGDTHGQYHDLLRIFEYCAFPPDSNYLFLGDYVDRGKQSIEVACLMFAYKVKYSENFFMLRGNHECASITRVYGFYDEVKRRYNIKLWKQFCDTFNCFPVCGLIDDRIICMHGGLSPALKDLDQIRSLQRPADIPDHGLVTDLLWSDPHPDLRGYRNSDRGVSYVFGADVVKKFLEEQDLELIVRAHQVIEDGYEFFANRQLLTIFSAPNYCGEFDNCGAMMSIDEDLQCSFQILKPMVGRRLSQT